MTSQTSSPEGEQQGRKATVGFSRKVNVPGKQYENEEYSIYLEVPTDPDADLATVLEEIHAAYVGIKSEVYAQAKLTFEVTADDVVVERLERVLNATPANKGYAPKPSETGWSGGGHSKVEAWADLAENPKGWFDNREQAAGTKRPAFKAKNTNKNFGQGPDPTALWLPAPDSVELPDPSAF